MKTRMRTRILALLLSMAMVMNGGISALASEAAPVANEETGHKHTAECYVEEKTVTCGLEQSEGHSHGEGCYTTTITCGQEEFEGHSHTDDCYTTTVSTCEKDEHTHSEGCNSEESPCGIEEHTHDDGCTTETTELTCGQEEVTGHTHDDSCKITELTCGQEEVTGHTHSDACYTTASTLVCTIPETETEVNPITEDLEVCEVCGLEECACEKEEPEACEKCELSLEECTCEKEESVVCVCGNEACECTTCEEGCTCGEEVVPETVTLYEDDYVIVSVDAVDAEAIPEGITLQVVPVTMENEETTEQYVAVAEELQETVKDENYGIAGFLAYDITFVDAEGNEVEPNGAVKISMSYKEAAVPKALDETVASEAEVTVMHLEENENGEVAKVVDMKESAQLENIQTSDENKVEAAEFTTNSFSVFTIVWKSVASIKAYCVDETGSSIGERELEIKKLMIEDSATDEYVIKFDAANWTETIVSKGVDDPDDYSFECAYLDTASNVIKRLRYDETEAKWQYSKTTDTDDWSDVGTYVLYLQYAEVIPATINYVGQNALRIPTVTNSGIKIGLYNYDGTTNPENTITYADDNKTITGITYNSTAADVGFQFIGNTCGSDYYDHDGKPEGEDSRMVGKRPEAISGYKPSNYNLQYTYGWGGAAGNATDDFARQDMVCYNLNSAGYPVLNTNYSGITDAGGPVYEQTKPTQKGASIGKYFGETSVSGVTKYENLTGLLQMNSDGYYYYDSNLNHAQYNENTGNIDVYDALLTHKKNQSTGQFLPFNKIEEATRVVDIDSSGKARYDYGDEYGVCGCGVPKASCNKGVNCNCTTEAKCTADDKEGNTKNNCVNKNTTPTTIDKFYANQYGDLWFGMKIEVPKFAQPKNGIENGKPVVFEFSGDDDVWVFIDRIKVLDIGGIHGVISGSINFATGDVVVTPEDATAAENRTMTTTIYECYKKAYKEEYGIDATDEYLDDVFVEYETGKYRFRNYTEHSMHFFYMERGASLSNCKVEFNLPVLPENSITVQKEIANHEDKYSNVEFNFKLYACTDEQYRDTPTNQLTTEMFSVYTGNYTTGTGELKKTADDGTFKLKHNEKVIFSDKEGLPYNTRYYVEEVVNPEEYDNVNITNNGVEDANHNNISSELSTYKSKILTIGEDFILTFENVCDEVNLNHLLIKKVLDEDFVTKEGFVSDNYTLKVYLSGEPYTGQYILKDAEGKESTKTASNGIVILEHGESAEILGYVKNLAGDGYGIPAGTTFKVEEVRAEKTVSNGFTSGFESALNTQNYAAPGYTITETTATETSNRSGFAPNGGIEGTILLSQNGEVTVTNKLLRGKLYIDKTLLRYNDTLNGATFVFKVIAKYQDVTLYDDVVSLTFDKNSSGTETYASLPLFPAGTVVTVEEVYSGASYVLTTDKEKSVCIVGDAIRDAFTRVAFTNDYKDGRLNSGTAVVNTFVKDTNDGSWKCTPSAKDQQVNMLYYNNQAIIPTNATSDENNGYVLKKPEEKDKDKIAADLKNVEL